MKINNYLDHYTLSAALSYISTHTAAGMRAQAFTISTWLQRRRLVSVFTGCASFSFFFFFYYYWWQKLQLLLMTGNLKVPLLNSHRCHVVLNQLRKKTAEAMQEQRAHKSLFTDGTLVFYVAISRLEFLVTQMFNRSSAGVQPHEREAKNCSVCSWSAV